MYIQRVLFLLLITGGLLAKELYIVTNSTFPVDHLTKSELKAIFLDKKHFIGGQKILPINYTTDNPLRSCFEKKVLRKSRKSLEHYWLKAHYHGKRPPKVVKSSAMLLEYLRKLPAAIGYIDSNTTIDHTFKILFRIQCP